MAAERTDAAVLDSVDVVVVGAGAAGLVAAIAAGEQSAKVALCERLDRPGVKLLATGGGQCNITNMASTTDLMTAFGRQGRFMQDALAQMDSAGVQEFFNALGVPTSSPDGFLVYPDSHRAIDVLRALTARCDALGLRWHLGTRVKKILCRPDEQGRMRVEGVQTPLGRIDARAVVLACGGKSYPTLGSDGSGFDLAADAGHKVVPPVPALAPLVTSETWPANCAGVSLKEVRCWVDLPRSDKAGCSGPMIFTHTGVSGPAILDLSRQVADQLRRRDAVPIRIDLTPQIDRKQWLARLDEWGHQQGAKLIRSLLADCGEPGRAEHLAASLCDQLCTQAGLADDAKAAHLSRAQRDRLAGDITSLPLTVTGTEGFEQAIVTRGGVSLAQVDPRTLQSRLVRGLFFAGELLDLDGPCGGYNLTWAFSSGHLAGQSAGAGRSANDD